MAGGTGIRNEIGLRRILAATEALPGVAATPDYRWYGNLAIEKNAPLVRTPEMTGAYDQFVTPRREVPTFSGTYGENLTFQSFTEHLQYAIKGGVSGVADDDGFIYTFVPAASDDDIASATLEYGVDGQVWQSTGVRHNEFTVTIDTDDADGVWKASSNLFVRDKSQLVGDSGTATGGTTSTLIDSGKAWSVNQWAGAWVFVDFGTGSGEVRQVASNTATTLTFEAPVLSGAPTGSVYRIEDLFTSGVAFATYDTIPVPGTKIYIDPSDGTIGTNQLVERMISYNITVNNARVGKRFADNVDELATKTGRGGRIISGQVRLEFDRRDEYQQYEDLDEVAIRVVQEGPALGVTPGDVMYAQIDVTRAVWDVVAMDERDNNITATFGFLAYLNPGEDIVSFEGKHDLSALP
jgi:hypothetical protein